MPLVTLAGHNGTMEGMDDGQQLPLTWRKYCYIEQTPYVHIFANLITSNYYHSNTHMDGEANPPKSDRNKKLSANFWRAAFIESER